MCRDGHQRHPWNLLILMVWCMSSNFHNLHTDMNSCPRRFSRLCDRFHTTLFTKVFPFIGRASKACDAKFHAQPTLLSREPWLRLLDFAYNLCWLHLVRRLMDVNLSHNPDSVYWKLTSNGIFTVKSMYIHLINSTPIPKSAHIWKTKVPLRIKIFMWFVHKGVILTKDNLAKRNWKGNARCSFCPDKETIQHLFLDCPLAKLVLVTTKRSMVLVTTRLPDKAEMVKTTGPIALRGLESDEFLKFFKTQIFGENKHEYDQEDLDDLARDIAKKLKGSPLAAKTVGRLLSKKFSREHWMGVLENNEWQNQKSTDDIMPSLRISYDYLPFHLKKCFSYFALFLEDFKFNNLDLTYFWIALGIIEKDENYMEELVNNGFLVKVVDDSEKPYYLMHDLLHELSKNVSSQECLNICSSNFRVDDVPRTVRHLSITTEDRFEGHFRGEMIKLRSYIDIGNQRALMIFRENEETIDAVLQDIFQEIEGLRVLYIVAVSREYLPLRFSKLIHLRYLKIKTLYSYPRPEITLHSTLCRCYHLKFLELKGYTSYKLPKDIRCLVNLCHFRVKKELHSNVPWVGKMKCLRELKQFCVKKESVGFELSELGELTELGGKLGIHNLEKVATKEEAAKAKILYKRDLKDLRLVWGTDHQHSTESDVLDGLQPHHKLGALSIINHGGTRGPSWLWGDNSLKELGSLHLEGVSWGTLPPFGQLLHLTSLTLINISVLHEIKPGLFGVTDESFQHLKRVVLGNLPEFIEWVGGTNVHCFSGLEYISCRDCPNICAVPFLECSVSYDNLTSFCVVGCPKLSLPPMPHRSTLESLEVGLSSTELSYHVPDIDINGYSGELAFHNLHKVWLIEIKDVSHISLTELSKLKSLRQLEVTTCNITCQGLQELTWLENLIVADCGNFFRWPIEAANTIVPFPASLKRLEIYREASMKSMALLSNLTYLTVLELVDCENLTVDGFNPLIKLNLVSLDVYNTGACLSRSISADLFSELAVARTSLTLPAGSFQLRYLAVDCISAVLVPPICTLLAATLRYLKAMNDERAESFMGEEDRALQLLTSLESIGFVHCPNLPALPQGLYNLPSLWDLRIVFVRSPQIRSLPKGPFPTSLKRVYARDCSPELQEQVVKLKEIYPDLKV